MAFFVSSNEEYDPCSRPDIGLLDMWTLKLVLERAADAKFNEKLGGNGNGTVALGGSSAGPPVQSQGHAVPASLADFDNSGASTSRGGPLPGIATTSSDGDGLPTATDVIKQYIQVAGEEPDAAERLRQTNGAAAEVAFSPAASDAPTALSEFSMMGAPTPTYSVGPGKYP